MELKMEPIISKLHFKSYLYVIALHKSKSFKKISFLKKYKDYCNDWVQFEGSIYFFLWKKKDESSWVPWTFHGDLNYIIVASTGAQAHLYYLLYMS